jgi:tRNA(Arg) A34 adenosine deaminase TadA
MKKFYRIPLCIATGLLGLVLVFFFTLKVQYFWSNVDLSVGAESILEREGRIAFKGGDVPVAAVLWFGDSLIGKGSNTVNRLLEAEGHAEINAISDALKKIGMDKFKRLSRDSLLLITTFEPCGMCRGAIVEYNIQRVVFIKEKNLGYLLRNEFWREWKYYFQRRKADSDLQDRLFREAGK